MYVVHLCFPFLFYCLIPTDTRLSTPRVDYKMYKKTCWLYNKAKITLQVYKYPLRIVNYKVIMVIKLPNLFNPAFEIFKGP